MSSGNPKNWIIWVRIYPLEGDIDILEHIEVFDRLKHLGRYQALEIGRVPRLGYLENVEAVGLTSDYRREGVEPLTDRYKIYAQMTAQAVEMPQARVIHAPDPSIGGYFVEDNEGRIIGISFPDLVGFAPNPI